jgi:hypothetical protein
MSTKEELYERASELEIEGRSSMSKAELEAAIAECEADEGSDDGFKVTAPMEDPVGTVVDHRDDLAAEAAGEDEDGEAVEPLSFEETTTTLNGERAASGDPEVTWRQIEENRRTGYNPMADVVVVSEPEEDEEEA